MVSSPFPCGKTGKRLRVLLPVPPLPVSPFAQPDFFDCLERARSTAPRPLFGGAAAGRARRAAGQGAERGAVQKSLKKDVEIP